MDDDDFDDEAYEDTGPSLAMPPLYVLRTAASCPECGTPMHVYTLGCSGFHEAGDSFAIEQFHFLRMIESVPGEVTTLLKAKCPAYFLDREEPSSIPYLMNHCRCGAKLDDDYLHGDVGAAFFPDTPSGYGAFKLFTLPVDAAIPVATSYMLGGGDDLDYEHARPFAEM